MVALALLFRMMLSVIPVSTIVVPTAEAFSVIVVWSPMVKVPLPPALVMVSLLPVAVDHVVAGAEVDHVAVAAGGDVVVAVAQGQRVLVAVGVQRVGAVAEGDDVRVAVGRDAVAAVADGDGVGGAVGGDGVVAVAEGDAVGVAVGGDGVVAAAGERWRRCCRWRVTMLAPLPRPILLKVPSTVTRLSPLPRVTELLVPPRIVTMSPDEAADRCRSARAHHDDVVGAGGGQHVLAVAEQELAVAGAAVDGELARRAEQAVGLGHRVVGAADVDGLGDVRQVGAGDRRCRRRCR